AFLPKNANCQGVDGRSQIWSGFPRHIPGNRSCFASSAHVGGAKAAQFSVIYHHKEERKRHETGGLSAMVCGVVLSLQGPVAGCGEGGHHEGKQGARRMSELIALQGRCLCTFGSSVPCRLRMAIAG